MDNLKPLIVACRCGWQGDDRQLISVKDAPSRYCPSCGRLFVPFMPVYGSKPAD